jgi:3-hydroxybutyryl-CoA dehydratase
MPEIIAKKFEDWKVGDSDFVSKTITETDVVLFAGITGDFNPLHVNDAFAKKSQFGRRVVHGVISAGLISAVLGMKLPGPGALYLDQVVRFKKPTFIGDTLTATGTIKDKIVKQKEGKPPMNMLKIETIVTNQDGVVVTEGEATILVM